MTFKDSKTFHSLANAFAGESQARNRYTFYASVAKKEGYQAIHSIFLETAYNEEQHAKVFYKFLANNAPDANLIKVTADYPLAYKDTLFNLRAAAEGEKEEWQIVYSDFSDIAASEGFDEISKSFHNIAEVESHHYSRYLELAVNLENGTLFKKDHETDWKCSNCGYVHHAKEAPESCPACDHPIGYFIELPQKY